MKNILLIGCGKLGFRYLQAINRLNLKFECTVIEKKKIIRDKLKIIFDQKFKFYPNIPSTSKKFDICIVVTQAKNRYLAVVNTNKKVTCKNWILEKNLAITPKQIILLNNELRKKNVWINTPLRIFKIFKYLKKNRKKIIDVKIFGKNWGLSSNAIHFIDVFSWIFKSKLKEINFSQNIKWIFNKKNKTWEIFGSILILFNNKKIIKIKHEKTKKNIFTTLIEARTKKDKIKIDQLNYKIFKNKEQLMIKETISPYLSIHMTRIINDILLIKKCNLPKLSNTFCNHKIFVQELQRSFFYKNKKKKLIIN
ncbi:hypothetical protein OAM73_00010 [Candidatus Pelagibacter sp.]|nr:hypothetical protein [Candidatus Pelagibacter sp.]